MGRLGPYELNTVVAGNCLDIMAKMPSGCVDLVVTDPPYPGILRDYGYWTVKEWWVLVVENAIPELRRILKPDASAVFILRPNSKHSGQMRGWVWEFMAWVCQEWNMVQDAWWWNYTALPSGGATQGGLLRGSISACVWCGEPNCYRNQDAVLWQESDHTTYRRKVWRARTDLYDRRHSLPSGHSFNLYRALDASERRGGTTPFNLIPAQHDGWRKKSGHCLHGAPTPTALVSWWIRYLSQEKDLVFDPFMGGGTTAVAADRLGRNFFGCDINPAYVEMGLKRLWRDRESRAQLELELF